MVDRSDDSPDKTGPRDNVNPRADCGGRACGTDTSLADGWGDIREMKVD